MKAALQVLGSGAAAAALLYGLLWAVEPRILPAEDPWLEGWRAAGFKVQLDVVDTHPSKHLIFVDGREIFSRPGLEDSTLRRYTLQGAKAQTVRLPADDPLEEIPEGRHPDFRLRKKGGTVHACRSGRDLLLVSTQVNTPVLGNLKVSPSFVEKVFDAFENTARSHR